MIREDFEALLLKTQAECQQVMIGKSKDYATEDVLSNFKRLSSAAKSINIDVRTPIGYSLFMCLMKMDRINNLVSSNKTPTNEAVADSYIDLMNYTTLSLACYKEGSNVDAIK